MITLDNFAKIVVDPGCGERSPCKHHCEVILKDARGSSNLTNFEIYSSNIAKEKINPATNANIDWDANRIIAHFSMYSKSLSVIPPFMKNEDATEWRPPSPQEMLTKFFLNDA